MMGCSAGDPECYAEEKPVHRVSITRPFEMGKFQVTQAEYEAVMTTNPSYSQGPNLPVEGVSWEDAQKFCEAVNRQGGRLPLSPADRGGMGIRGTRAEIVPADMVRCFKLHGSETIRAVRLIR